MIRPTGPQVIQTNVPARLDRLPWGRWHWRAIISLGTSLAMVGFGAGAVAAAAPVLTESQSLGLSPLLVGASWMAYGIGAVAGAVLFGYVADLGGRKRAMLFCVAAFAFGTLASALSWGFWSFASFRLFAGIGAGGLVPVANSMVVELVPPRSRGWAALAVNSGYWVGALLSTAASILFLNPIVLPRTVGWRILFALGGVLPISVPLLVRQLPESPRWMMVTGRAALANLALVSIEQQVRQSARGRQLATPAGAITIRLQPRVELPAIVRMLATVYLQRSLLSVTLITAQAFLFSSIFFTYALALVIFYHVPPHGAGAYLVPLATAGFLGPSSLGRLFDVLGRKPMIALSYAIEGLFLGIGGYLFAHGLLGAAGLTLVWLGVFFFASAGAGGAFLTAAELFPQELRAAAAGLLYGIGTAFGGLVGPPLFATLIVAGVSPNLFYSYLALALLLLLCALVELLLGIRTERRPLEGVAHLLSAMTVRERPAQRKRARKKAA